MQLQKKKTAKVTVCAPFNLAAVERWMKRQTLKVIEKFRSIRDLK